MEESNGNHLELFDITTNSIDGTDEDSDDNDGMINKHLVMEKSSNEVMRTLKLVKIKFPQNNANE